MRTRWRLGMALCLITALSPVAHARDSGTGGDGTGTAEEDAAARGAADGGVAAPGEKEGAASGRASQTQPPDYVAWFLRMRSDLTQVQFEANALRQRMGRLDVTAQAHLSQRLDGILAREVELGQALDQLQQLPRKAWLTRYGDYQEDVRALEAELEDFASTLTDWGA